MPAPMTLAEFALAGTLAVCVGLGHALMMLLALRDDGIDRKLQGRPPCPEPPDMAPRRPTPTVLPPLPDGCQRPMDTAAGEDRAA